MVTGDIWLAWTLWGGSYSIMSRPHLPEYFDSAMVEQYEDIVPCPHLGAGMVAEYWLAWTLWGGALNGGRKGDLLTYWGILSVSRWERENGTKWEAL